MANVWDRFGKIIGSVRDLGNGESNTYDEHGQPLGKVRETGTYDNNGRKISSTQDSGLTFARKRPS
jgi:YD repeat-containing protein